jgi:hypothetical protein
MSRQWRVGILACWNSALKGGWTAVDIVDVKDFLAESCFNNNIVLWRYVI